MYDLIGRYLARAWLGDLRENTGLAALAQLEKKLEGVWRPSPLREVAPSTGEVRDVLGLMNDAGWFIALTSEGVQVELRQPVGSTVTFPSFLAASAGYVAAVADWAQRKANRIAALQEGLLPTLSKAELEGAASRLLVAPSVFAKRPPFEWDWRMCALIDREFAGGNHPTNTIVSVRRTQGVIGSVQQFDRLQVMTDINTPPQDSERRFGSVELEGFFGASAEWHNELAKDVLSLAGVKLP